MTYHLGIDLGTTYTGAAVRRDGRSEMVTLGNRAPVVPSVVYLRDDGTVLVGEPASRRGLTDPGRIAREFKRRFGDPTPLLLGGTPRSPEALTALLLRWVFDAVVEREGGEPLSIALTHPANWGDYKRDLLRQSIRLADLPNVQLLSEPEAAAIYYASLERVGPGTVVAVYDLGGGTFDAVVLRKGDGFGFEIMGEPEGIERLGGVDFDEAVFRYVLGVAAVEDLDASDPATTAALMRVREECIAAKESLSTDTDVALPVILPNLQTEVRLTRGEFEEMIRPTLGDTLAAMQRALRSAGVSADDVDRVLLVGGSSRIPVVSELIARELGRPVALDAQPKHAVALGASIAAAGSSEPPIPVQPVITPPAEPAPPVTVAAAAAAAGSIGTPPPPASQPVTDDPPDSRRSRSPLLWIAVIVALAIVAIGVVLATRSSEDAADQPAPGTAVATTAPTESTAAAAVTATTELAAAATAPATTAVPTTLPPGPYVEITAVAGRDDRYVIDFTPHEFDPSFSGTFHVHFFWDTTERASAGVNGEPAPGDWLIWDLPTTVDDPYFSVSSRPPLAEAVCALVATVDHAIADIDGDGVIDLETGNCSPLP